MYQIITLYFILTVIRHASQSWGKIIEKREIWTQT